MDSEHEFRAKTLFFQGSYAACRKAIEAISEPSFQLDLFLARALMALGLPTQAVGLLSKHHDAHPVARALTLLANYHAQPPTTDALRDRLAEQAEGLTEHLADEDLDGPDSILRVTLAALLALAGNVTLAIFLLKQGVQLRSLEAVALLISLYLSPHLRRPDLARALYRSVKTWADDAILLQMAEAWIGATTGSAAANPTGKEPGGYQAAFYVFDESANSGAASAIHGNVVGLNGKAVTQLAMGHLDEAHANLVEALRVNPEHECSLANSVVISAHLDHGTPEAHGHLEKLKQLNPLHPLIRDLERQDTLFDEAASKFLASTA